MKGGKEWYVDEDLWEALVARAWRTPRPISGRTRSRLSTSIRDLRRREKLAEAEEAGVTRMLARRSRWDGTAERRARLLARMEPGRWYRTGELEALEDEAPQVRSLVRRMAEESVLEAVEARSSFRGRVAYRYRLSPAGEAVRRFLGAME